METASEQVPGFKELALTLERSFAINGKAASTLRNYLRCLAHLALHCKCSPELLDEERIDDYLYHCQNLHDTRSESFFKHTVFGLRAAYKVLGMDGKRIRLPQIKRQNDLPVVLNKREVRELLNAPKYLKHRLMLAMLYGCGLRSYELCNLLRADIDFDRKTVFVKKRKGKVDRYVPLSPHLARGLKAYFSTENPVKHVFNGRVTKNGAVGPLTAAGIQWVIKECRSKVSGHTRAIDSAPVKANASMDTLELKLPEEELDEHLRKVRAISAMDKGRPSIEQDLQGLPASDNMFGEGQREAVLGNLLSGRIRAEHRTRGEPLYEGQAAKYGGTRFRHAHPVHGPAENKYHRYRTGEQGDAPLSDSV